MGGPLVASCWSGEVNSTLNLDVPIANGKISGENIKDVLTHG